MSKFSNEKAPKKFGCAIVLGGGLKPTGVAFSLTLDSKIRVLAAGLIASEGMVSELILSGGKTAGQENPSEAELMKKFLLEKYPDLANFTLHLEDSSIDTLENAKAIAEMVQDKGEEPILLITNEYHMLRASRIFKNQGLNINEIPAELVVPKQKIPVGELKKKQAIELALRAMMRLDPSGRLPNKLAHILRDGRIV